jgi:protein-S-isoprenylcysteine O-methyltransferase Ste14
MHATRFEYRFRLWIIGILFAIGFGAIPLLNLYTPGILEATGISTKSTWLIATSLIARQQLLTFTTASVALLLIAVVFTGLGAWFRVWGAAYLPVQASSLITDGPYARTRNPLYLGLLLHAIGIAILMPPVGAIFTVVTVWVFVIRLALAEELSLTQLGQPYLSYKTAVPRLLPAPTPQVASSGISPHWLQGVLAEIYFIGVSLTLLVFGWSFNANPLYRGILISLGVAIIAKALQPRPATTPAHAV